MGQFVQLQATPAALEALRTGLTSYGPAAGDPAWLVGGVWLATRGARLLATAAVDVLADGQVARPLCLHSPSELVEQIAADLPDIIGRLRSRGSDLSFGPPPSLPPAPTLKPWPAAPYFMAVLVRAYRRQAAINHIACGLLFRSEAGRHLLISTDPHSLALVFSEEMDLVERYEADCEVLSLDRYLARCSG
ncbi:MULTISPECIES: hypothetical protein [Sphingomonas]|uniref:hypothetical protein n=1 Tax=Sphingomonas TaxID=13687 RepID=UPI000DEF8F46|nr:MULTISPECIES: hypothetical protein [Sphingomonas]